MRRGRCGRCSARPPSLRRRTRSPGRSASCSSSEAQADSRSCASSTTCTGRRRRCSTCRARRRPLARRADPAALHGPARAARAQAVVGAAASGTRPRCCSSRSTPTRPSDCSRSLAGVDGELRAADRPGRRGQPAVPRGDARPRPRQHSAERRGSADDSGAARCPTRPTRPRRAYRAGARLGRGPTLSSWCGRRDGRRRRRARPAAASRWCARSSCGLIARSSLGDDAYRFRHLLIRDAAYDALPKSVSRRPPPPLRRLARRARARPGRARRDPRLPPRAGGSLSRRARAARPRAGGRSVGQARRCGPARTLALRPPRSTPASSARVRPHGTTRRTSRGRSRENLEPRAKRRRS